MSNKRYNEDFKVMIAELMLSGQSAENLSKEYGVHAASIRKWKNTYLSNKGALGNSNPPSLTLEQKEIHQLKKKLKEAELERDILKKAVSIISKSDKNDINLY